jgi:hypothetical protein
MMVILSLPLFVVNYRQDRIHARAFAEAVEKPIDDRLGMDWREKYFPVGP